MKKLQQYRSGFTFAFIHLIPFMVFGQDQQDVEMADAFRADGKIYVVIAGMAIILAGLFLYLFRIEKKVTALEKKVPGKK